MGGGPQGSSLSGTGLGTPTSEVQTGSHPAVPKGTPSVCAAGKRRLSGRPRDLRAGCHAWCWRCSEGFLPSPFLSFQMEELRESFLETGALHGVRHVLGLWPRPGAGDRLKSAAFGPEGTAVALGLELAEGQRGRRVTPTAHWRFVATPLPVALCVRHPPSGACGDLATRPCVLRGWFGLS